MDRHQQEQTLIKSVFSGLPMRKIEAIEGMPSRTTLCKWIRNDDRLKRDYRKAKADFIYSLEIRKKEMEENSDHSAQSKQAIYALGKKIRQMSMRT